MLGARIYVRNASRQRVAEVDDFQSFVMTLRFNDIGRWVLDMDASTDAARALLAEGAGIVVAARDGTTLLSGPVDDVDRQRDGDKNRLTLSGPDDLVVLSDALALPVPAGPPYTSQAYDVRSGAAETVIRAYVDANAGPSALAQRRVTGLTLAADAGAGTTVTGRARFQILLELLRELALAGGGLGFRIAQSGAGLEFQVYVPEDRTATAVFSLELGNLASYRYRTRAPAANYLIVAGGGEGTARTFVEGGDSASIVRWHRRIERFRDRRDTTDATELEQTLTQDLESQAEEMGLEIAPIDTDQLAFLTHYGLGDRVTVVVDGEPIQDVVRQVEIRLTPDDGETVVPLVGGANAEQTKAPGVLGALRRLAGRISTVERR